MTAPRYSSSVLHGGRRRTDRPELRAAVALVLGLAAVGAGTIVAAILLLAWWVVA